MKRISLSDAIDWLSKKYFKYDAVTFYERVRDGKKVEARVDGLAGFLTDVASEAYEFERLKHEEIVKLKDEIKKLQSLLNKSPDNSHKPPSSERFKKIKNSRVKTDKPMGGQVGHEGHAHELHDSPDQVHRYEPQKCDNCGSDLKRAPEHEVLRKQVVDIKKGQLHVTEYQTVIKFCPECGQWNRAEAPKDVTKSRITFGSDVKCIAVYLVAQQLLPFWRTQEILLDLFGVPISQGSICNFMKEFGGKLTNWEVETKLRLLASPLNHVDETSMRCEKRNDWVHVISNESLTLLSYHQKRGQEALDDIGVLPKYMGHLVHDAFSAYWNYGKTHSLCNGHILRELKYFFEEEGQKWAFGMGEFLKSTLHQMHSGQKITASWKSKINSEFIANLKRGYHENGFAKEWCGRPPDGYKIQWERGKRLKVPIYRQRKHSKVMNLLNRLRDYQVEVLSFAVKSNTPFTNNQAERDFRMIKLKEKISGCFRSSEMAKVFLRVRSYLSTLRKQQLHLLENLVLVDVCCEPA